jgi:nanoRNase/pAp phosphatase (c-di-AMP/oligoRNAs hydrolase)
MMTTPGRTSSNCWSFTFLMALVYSNIPVKAAFQLPQYTSILKAFSFRPPPCHRTTCLHGKRRRSRAKAERESPIVNEPLSSQENTIAKSAMKTYPATFLEDNGIRLSTREDGDIHAELGPIRGEPQLQLDEVGMEDLGLIGFIDTVDFANSKGEDRNLMQEATAKSMSDLDVTKKNNAESASADQRRDNGETEIIITQSTSTIESTSILVAPETLTKTARKLAIETTRVAGDRSVATKASEAIFFKRKSTELKEQPAKVVPRSGFNVVLTHCTADFDSLASAVGLAKLWASDSSVLPSAVSDGESLTKKNFDSASHVPTFVVLPRGAHPGVQRFLALHKHLFPIRSLRSLPDDLTGLNRLGLVDAQRRDRIGPAENLLQYAKRVTVVDHHIDSDTDIPEATDYVVDQVGSVSTLIVERLQQAELDLTEAEATLLALGIHADTGSLCFDSTTARDAMALAWVMAQGASQAAIAEHAQSSLSPEQQGVLTQALINTNSTIVHGVTLSTVLLSADGFINGLAAVTQDALELSSSDIFLLAVVYEAQSGGKRRSKTGKRNQSERLTARLLSKLEEHSPAHRSMDRQSSQKNTIRNVILNASPNPMQNYTAEEMAQAQTMFAQAWRGGEDAMRRRRLQAAFERNDLDASGFLERHEMSTTLAGAGIIASQEDVQELMDAIDSDGDGRVDFEEFVSFAINAEKRLQEEGSSRASTMIIIGRVKAGVNMKGVKLNRLLERFGGGGHAKAASATLRLNDESEAEGVLQGLVDEIITTSLQEQVTVGDFMTAPVLSVKPHMTVPQVEDLFTRYDVRGLPVVDENNEVVGLVTYKEVAAAKQRMWNKEQKQLRREKEAAEKGEQIPIAEQDKGKERQRRAGSTVKGWMLQHVRIVEDSTTMAELEALLLESDVGCIPVVADGTKKLIGMVTRTDLLRQHRYYPSLHYHNKGFADSISARKPIIELRKRLKKFDLEDQ